MLKLRMRTLKEAHNEIMENDPNSAISFYFFRQSVLNGKIPHIKAGSRYLVNMAEVEAFFEGSNNDMSYVKQDTGVIRPVEERIKNYGK